MEKQRNEYKTCEELLCISDISGLHQGDRLKTAVHCFTVFIVNNSTLDVIPSVIFNLNYLSFLEHLSCINSEHIA